MSSWTWYLARRLFRFPDAPASNPEPPADPAPPPETESALIRACDALRAQQARGTQALTGMADGDWRRFADAVAESDGATREALDRVLGMPAQSAGGLRAKAEALRIAIEGVGEDAELASRIARSLIADALAVLPPP